MLVTKVIRDLSFGCHGHTDRTSPDTLSNITDSTNSQALTAEAELLYPVIGGISQLSLIFTSFWFLLMKLSESERCIFITLLGHPKLSNSLLKGPVFKIQRHLVVRTQIMTNWIPVPWTLPFQECHRVHQVTKWCQLLHWLFCQMKRFVYLAIYRYVFSWWSVRL